MNQYLVVGVVFLVVIALLATNKKLVETLKNIYKIEELRKRVIYTIGLLLVYRLGSFVVIPGINPNALGEGSALASQLDGNGLLGLLNVFSGGAFGNAAIFALGVMPYITASIIIQLMGMMIPYFQKMQKEGESGRRKMNQWTRFLTIGVLILQGPAYIANLYHQVPTAFVYGVRLRSLCDDDSHRRYHVHHVARREDHGQGYRQRYLADNHDRYCGPSAPRPVGRGQRAFPDR